MVVAADLSVPGHPEVFVVGDLRRRSAGVPGVAPAAIQMGQYAARTDPRGSRAASRPAPSATSTRAARHHRPPRAVGVAFGVPVAGLGAMLIWALVHVRYLVGWGNRLITTLRWLWTMLARDRAERVISTPEPSREPVEVLS